MCSLERKTFYSQVVWQKCLQNGGCKLAKWGCRYQGKWETERHREYSVCPKTQHKLLQQQTPIVCVTWFGLSKYHHFREPLNIAERTFRWWSRASNLGSAWHTDLSDTTRFLSFCTLHIFYLLWEEGQEKPMAFKKWKWKRCLQMWYQSRGDRDPSCLILRNTVWSWKPFFGVQGCDWRAPVSMHHQYRQRKISANSEPHKVHDLQMSQFNFIL